MSTLSQIILSVADAHPFHSTIKQSDLDFSEPHLLWQIVILISLTTFAIINLRKKQQAAQTHSASTRCN